MVRSTLSHPHEEYTFTLNPGPSIFYRSFTPRAGSTLMLPIPNSLATLEAPITRRKALQVGSLP